MNLKPFELGEALRDGRRLYSQFSHTPSNADRRSCALSTPDVVYRLVKVAEALNDECERLRTENAGLRKRAV